MPTAKPLTDEEARALAKRRAKRRAKNKVARKSRKVNRGKS
jgi:hypothetical protein